MGQLSELPEEILLAILSVMPLKSAIVTGVLSRRWRWLWTHVANIDISMGKGMHVFKKGSEFVSAVENLLPKIKCKSINRFSLDLRWVDSETMFMFMDGYRSKSHISRWFDWVSEPEKKVRELRVCMLSVIDSFPPLCVFNMSSLVSLHLMRWYLLNTDYDVSNELFHLPNLKQVTVELYAHDAAGLEKLVSSSPCLQHLSFEASFVNDKEYHTLNLSSLSLKRLEIQLRDPIVVVINAPNLEYLSVQRHITYTGVPYQISFANSPTNLSTCSLWAWSDKQDVDIFMPASNLFTAMSNVVTSLTTVDMEPTSLMAPITFTRLTHLKLRQNAKDIDGDNKNKMAFFSGLSLLHQCPVLEVLILDMKRFYCTDTCRWSLPISTPQCLLTCVKRIEIVECHVYPVRENTFLALLNYFLDTAQALDLLRISLASNSRSNRARSYELNFINRLLELPIRSPHLSFEIYGAFHQVLGGVIKSSHMST